MATVQISGSRCFLLMMENVTLAARKVTMLEDAWCWHRKMGHLNFKTLEMLKHKEMVLGQPELKEYNGVCASSATGKKHSKAFSR